MNCKPEFSCKQSLRSACDKITSVYRGTSLEKNSPALGIYSRYLPRGVLEREARTAGLGIIAYVPLTTQLGPPWHMLDGYMSPVKDTKITNEYYYDSSSGALRQIRTYSTAEGCVTEDIGESLGAGSEHIGKYYISDSEDYRVLRKIIENTQLKSNEKKFKNAVTTLGEDGVVLGRIDRTPYQKTMIEFAGTEQFLMDLYSEEPELLKLMDMLAERWKEEFRMAVQSEAEFIWLPENVTSMLTPPSMFEKYHLPLYQYAADLAHSKGKTLIAHFDGAIRALVSLILDSGIDVVESVSDISIGGDVGLLDGEIYRLLPGKVILPNFPSNYAYADASVISRYIRTLAEAAEDKPFMLQISEDIPEDSTQYVIKEILHVWDTMGW